MLRSRAGIANTAVRIFLHDVGVAYDEENGREPYKKSKNLRAPKVS